MNLADLKVGQIFRFNSRGSFQESECRCVFIMRENMVAEIYKGCNFLNMTTHQNGHRWKPWPNRPVVVLSMESALQRLES